jgi:hypothetical protein
MAGVDGCGQHLRGLASYRHHPSAATGAICQGPTRSARRIKTASNPQKKTTTIQHGFAPSVGLPLEIMPGIAGRAEGLWTTAAVDNFGGLFRYCATLLGQGGNPLLLKCFASFEFVEDGRDAGRASQSLGRTAGPRGCTLDGSIERRPDEATKTRRPEGSGGARVPEREAAVRKRWSRSAEAGVATRERWCRSGGARAAVPGVARSCGGAGTAERRQARKRIRRAGGPTGTG